MPNNGPMQFANMGASVLAVDLLPGDLTASVANASTYPAIVPGQNFLLVIERVDLSAFEVVRVTAVVGNSLTIERGVGGTTPGTFETGDSAENRVTMSTLDELVNGIVQNASDIGQNASDVLERMKWRNTWVTTSYLLNDVVIDGDWTMVANKATDERPSPQPVGPAFDVFDGTLVPAANVANQVIFGARYTILNGGNLLGARIDVVAGNRYVVRTIVDPLGVPVVNNLLDIVAPDSGWLSFNIVPAYVGAGAVFDLIATVNEPDPTPTTFNGDWDYQTPQNNSAPGAGILIQSNSSPSLMSISYTDDAAADRTVALQALIVGDIIDSGGIKWAIQSIQDQGTYIDFGVSPAVQTAPDGVRNFIFETVTATPITTGSDANYWATSPYTVSGLFGVDIPYTSIVPNDTAYGVDIKVQETSFPDDWDVLAVSSQAGAVGGGGDVTKVDIPVDNQIGVWTGDGTIEGTTTFTWDGDNHLMARAGGAIKTLWQDTNGTANQRTFGIEATAGTLRIGTWQDNLLSSSSSIIFNRSGTSVNLIQIFDEITSFQEITTSVDMHARKIFLGASTTIRASLNMAEGVAPTSPADGDLWITAAGEFNAQLNGVTVDVASGGVELPVGALQFGYDPNGLQVGTWTQLPEGTFIMATVAGLDTAGGSNDAAVIAHAHNANSNNTGSHSHVLGLSTSSNNQARAQTGTTTRNLNVATDAAGNHSHTITVDSAGVAATGMNRPLYKGVEVWERTL